ncbi:MAG: hypothetical protein ACKVOB_13450 [Sphingomonas sp.]
MALPSAPSRSDPANFATKADAFVAALPQFETDMNAALVAAQGAATATTIGSSATSVAVGTGSKVFTTQAGKNWAVGSWLSTASAANPTTQYMGGIVTAYSGTTLTVNVPSNAFVGSGSFTDWIIALSGQTLTTGPLASVAEIRAGTDATKALTTNAVMGASASVSLADAATITPDLATGMNFHVTLAGNRTLANPTNQIAGQSGRFRITQDATGSRTLSYGTAWDFPGGAPVLSTAANAIDVFGFYVHASGQIECSLIKALS